MTSSLSTKLPDNQRKFLQDILLAETISEETQATTNNAVYILYQIFPEGMVIGSYAYGLQTIHTDVDFIVVDKTPLEKIAELLHYNKFTDVIAINDNIICKYLNVQIDLHVYPKPTGLYYLFEKELGIYRIFKYLPSVCIAIRILNQWYHNRKLQGCEMGYIHSTTIYATMIRIINNITDESQICISDPADIVKYYINYYANISVKSLIHICKSADIRMTTSVGYQLFHKEIILFNEYLKKSDFINGMAVLSKETVLKEYPYCIIVVFSDNTISATKSLRYIDIPDIRLYPESSSEVYIFCKRPIVRKQLYTYLDSARRYFPKNMIDVRSP
jgi:hypothetical protein